MLLKEKRPKLFELLDQFREAYSLMNKEAKIELHRPVKFKFELKINGEAIYTGSPASMAAFLESAVIFLPIINDWRKNNV